MKIQVVRLHGFFNEEKEFIQNMGIEPETITEEELPEKIAKLDDIGDRIKRAAEFIANKNQSSKNIVRLGTLTNSPITITQRYLI
jgi:hypothetical protein